MGVAVGRFIRANSILCVAFALAIAVAFCGFVVVWLVLVYPKASIPKGDQVGEVEKQVLVPTELSQTLNLFGPWEPSRMDPAEMIYSSGKLLLLHENGSVSVSSFMIQFPSDVNWSAGRPPEIWAVSVEKNGAVVFETNTERRFEVSVSQPFILEQTPRMIYVITADRKVWAVSVEKAKTLRYKPE